MSKKNYYDVLGVVPTISQPDLIKAFRKLIVSKHPDKNPHDPQIYQEFLLITEAYGVLGDPFKRRRYDIGNVGNMGDGMNDSTPHNTHHSSLFFTRFSMDFRGSRGDLFSDHGTPLDQSWTSSDLRGCLLEDLGDQDNSENNDGYAADFQEEDLFMKRKQSALQHPQ